MKVGSIGAQSSVDGWLDTDKFFGQWFRKRNHYCTSLLNIMSVVLLNTLHSELEPLPPLLGIEKRCDFSSGP